MEIILKANVPHLGKMLDVVKVKDGYARNYLFPRKLAYTIKKRQHGYYVIFYYKAEAAVVANMEAALKLNENALRWMTLVDYPMSEIVYNQDMAQSTEEIIPVDAEEGEAE